MPVGSSTGQQYETMFEAVKGQPAETAEPGLDTSFNKWARPYTSSTPTGPVSVPDLGGPDSHPVPPNLPNSPDEPDFEERWKQMFPKYELSLQKFLSHPEVSDNLNNLKVDRTHDVPYEAGPSKTGSTLYLDKSIPHEAHVSGVSFDPAVPASIHEFTERHVMNQLTKKGMTDEKAYEIAHHEFAEPAEDAWYRAHGIDVPEVNKLWAKWDKGTEQEKADDKDFPKDLYTKPYAHNKVEGVKHEPSGVSDEWAVGKMAMNEKHHPPILTPDPTTTGHLGGVEPLKSGGGKIIPETIHSAAIQHPNGNVYIGINHADAYEQMPTGEKLSLEKATDFASTQGYVTNKGRFVSRHEGQDIAEAAKQKVVDFGSRHGLLSEELDPSYKEPILPLLRQYFGPEAK